MRLLIAVDNGVKNIGECAPAIPRVGIAEYQSQGWAPLAPHERRKARTMSTHHHRLASIAQVAADLGVSYRTIQRWIKKGMLPATKIGHQIRIRWSDVDALLAKGKIPVDDVTGNALI
ncbi:MAG: helix-turn-helix domain-containing protein [Stellaceae bacterium]